MEEVELKDAVVLVYANKQDMPEALGVQDVADSLGLTSMRGRVWYIQACSATTGEGITEGVLATKTHWPFDAPCGDGCGADDGPGGPYARAVVLVRHPLSSLPSLFHYEQSAQSSAHNAEGQRRAWAALERGLEKYLVTLTKRRDALEQTASLAKENKELRGLVRQCLGADVNDALLVQPSALL